MFDQVYLTGFKKFGNHNLNPTELVVQHFQQHPIEGVKATVLEVAIQDIDGYLASIKQQQNQGKKIINLHFGVGPNKIYQLERFGYNKKHFGIPDNHGNHPQNQKICPHEALEFPIHSKLDLDQLKNKLNQDHKVALSIDPGRYICNYIYFKSLHDLTQGNQHVASLFIHFPVLEITPHQKNVTFVNQLVSLLLKS